MTTDSLWNKKAVYDHDHDHDDIDVDYYYYYYFCFFTPGSKETRG